MSEHYRQKPTIDILPKETVTAGTIVVTSAGEQTLDPHHFNATTFTVPDDVRLDPSVDAALIEWLREDAPHPLYAVAESSPGRSGNPRNDRRAPAHPGPVPHRPAFFVRPGADKPLPR